MKIIFEENILNLKIFFSKIQKTNILAKSSFKNKNIHSACNKQKQIQKLVHKIIILTKTLQKKKLLQNRIQLISALMINGNA